MGQLRGPWCGQPPDSELQYTPYNRVDFLVSLVISKVISNLIILNNTYNPAPPLD